MKSQPASDRLHQVAVDLLGQASISTRPGQHAHLRAMAGDVQQIADGLNNVGEDVINAHQHHGGYYCTCGHELNSPAGFTRHVVEMTLAEVAK